MQLSESVGCIQRMFAPNPVRGIPYAPALTERTFFHSVIRFHSSSFSFKRAPGKPKPFGFSRSEKPRHRGGFGLPGAPAQKKTDKGQYPLSAKRKCHTNIPAANILTLLPAARRAKRGLFEKSPLLNSRKNFWAAGAELWVCAPKVARQPISRTAGAPAAGGAGMSGERTQSDVSAYSPRRKAPRKKVSAARMSPTGSAPVSRSTVR